MPAAAWARRSSSRSTSTTCSAPRSSAAFAIASPMPPAAPVTTHRLPFRSMSRTYCVAIMRGMQLSVLDQSPIAEGATAADALANTLDLARLADDLGYRRYWLAEHHGGPMLAGFAPEVLIPSVAAATSRIRVGSGGVMLPHYSPFKVAEVFTLLAAMYPGRIDLGLGRASGTDPRTTFALQRDRSRAMEDDFPQQLAELLGYLDGKLRRLRGWPAWPTCGTPFVGCPPRSAN